MTNDNRTKSYLLNWKDTYAWYQLRLWPSSEHRSKIPFMKCIRCLHEPKNNASLFWKISAIDAFPPSSAFWTEFLSSTKSMKNSLCDKDSFVILKVIFGSPLELISNSFESSKDFGHVIKVIFRMQWNAHFYVTKNRKL